jgi:bifunctional DNA-binding transcriptional regulator/antitoxin component of YhaV-PrlF toxin-antitoxin module
MKKTMNIIKDKRQTRITIPKEFVEEFNITSENKFEFESKNKKLTGELK